MTTAPDQLPTWPRALPDRRSPCAIDAAKGVRRHRCSVSHAELVEGYRLALADQDARAEAATNGYETELARYFGTDGAGDGVEVRLTFRAWLEGHRDHHREEYDAA